MPPDTAGNFPAGHRLQSLPKGGKKCDLITGAWPARRWVAAGWEQLFGVREAEAVVLELTFSPANFFGNIAFTYHAQDHVDKFQGFEFTIHLGGDSPSPGG